MDGDRAELDELRLQCERDVRAVDIASARAALNRSRECVNLHRHSLYSISARQNEAHEDLVQAKHDAIALQSDLDAADERARASASRLAAHAEAHERAIAVVNSISDKLHEPSALDALHEARGDEPMVNALLEQAAHVVRRHAQRTEHVDAGAFGRARCCSGCCTALTANPPHCPPDSTNELQDTVASLRGTLARSMQQYSSAAEHASERWEEDRKDLAHRTAVAHGRVQELQSELEHLERQAAAEHDALAPCEHDKRAYLSVVRARVERLAAVVARCDASARAITHSFGPRYASAASGTLPASRSRDPHALHALAANARWRC